jgi:hypothetical protein
LAAEFFVGLLAGQGGGFAGIEDAGEEAFPGEGAVAGLGAAILAADGEASGVVEDFDGGGDFVDVLAAGAGGAAEALGEVFRAEAEGFEAFGEGGVHGREVKS